MTQKDHSSSPFYFVIWHLHCRTSCLGWSPVTCSETTAIVANMYVGSGILYFATRFTAESKSVIEDNSESSGAPSVILQRAHSRSLWGTRLTNCCYPERRTITTETRRDTSLLPNLRKLTFAPCA